MNVGSYTFLPHPRAKQKPHALNMYNVRADCSSEMSQAAATCIKSHRLCTKLSKAGGLPLQMHELLQSLTAKFVQKLIVTGF